MFCSSTLLIKNGSGHDAHIHGIAVRHHLGGGDPDRQPGQRFGVAAMRRRGDSGESCAINSMGMGMSTHALYNDFCSGRASSTALGCKTSTTSEQHCSNAMHSCAHDGCRCYPAGAMSAPNCEGVKDSHYNGIALKIVSCHQCAPCCCQRTCRSMQTPGSGSQPCR